MGKNRELYYKIGLFLTTLNIFGFVFSYVSGEKKSPEDYPKIILRAPIEFKVIDCGPKCRDWIEFKYKGEVFKFYQSNPFYSQFEKLANSDGFLTIWYDEGIENQIYQVSLNRKIIIPFDKLYSVKKF